jgi:hypothetical protein
MNPLRDVPIPVRTTPFFTLPSIRQTIIILFLCSVLLNVIKSFLGAIVTNVVFLLLVSSLLFFRPFIKLTWLRLSPIQIICGMNLTLIILHCLYSIFILETNINTSISFAIQFGFFWLGLLGLSLNTNHHFSCVELKRTLRCIHWIGIAVLVLSFCERIAPELFIAAIVSKMSIGKGIVDTVQRELPLSYFFIEMGFPIRRVGSIFMEPLTFGLFASLWAVSYTALCSYQVNGRKQTSIMGSAYFIGTALSFIKSGYVLLVAALIKKRLVLCVFITVIVVLGVKFASEIDKKPGIELSSMLMHVNGLTNGLANGLEHPFLGHGCGTAGFLTWVALKKSGEAAKYFDLSNPTRNGNESLLGIIAYQYGYIYLTLYLVSILYIVVKFLRLQGFHIAVLLFLIIIVSAFTESVLCILFQFSLAVILSLHYNLLSRIAPQLKKGGYVRSSYY